MTEPATPQTLPAVPDVLPSKLVHLKCFSQLLLKIRNGSSPESLAEWIQDVQHEYLHVRRESIVRQIYRFRKSQSAADMIAGTQSHIAAAIDRMSRKMNLLDERVQLYLVQKSRVDSAIGLEGKIKFPSKQTAREIELASRLLGEVIDLSVELGILKPKPPEPPAAPGASLSPSTGELSPEDRARVGNAAQALLGSLKAAVDGTRATPGEGGRATGEEVVEADFEVVAEESPQPQ